MKQLLSIILFLPLASIAQTSFTHIAEATARESGVKFVEGLTWEQLLTQAQKENKYIFIDCYATWCAPCKAMDKQVYPQPMVGEAMNSTFLSIKVQMDSTKKDADHVKIRYPLARKLEKAYSITALPTYLFFLPDGTLFHQAVGRYEASDFVQLVTQAKDQGKQLSTLVKQARKKQINWDKYPTLIKKIKTEYKSTALAKDIASFYNKKYLNKLPNKALLNKEHLDFIDENSTIVKPADKIFRLCLKHPALVDSIKETKGANWATTIVDNAILREITRPVIHQAKQANEEPNWGSLEKQISKRYGKAIGERLVLGERVNYYWSKKEWSSLLQYVKPYFAHLDLKKLNPRYVHWIVWFVFKYSDDKFLIADAQTWIDIVIEMAGQDEIHKYQALDTKACLLYKTGKVEEAKYLLKKLIKSYPPDLSARNPNGPKNLQSRLDLMMKGGPILFAREKDK